MILTSVLGVDVSLIKYNKKYDIVFDSDDSDEEIDLGHVIIFGIGSVIDKINKLINEDISVDIGNGIIVEIGSQNYLFPWKERLRSILDLVSSIDIDGFDFCSVVEKILIADGWSWNRFFLKTPVWMFDFYEIPLSEIINEFEGMSWIEKYILETE